jgi:hypothetical protein
VLEAADHDERLTSVEREILAGNVRNFMGIVDAVDRCPRGGTG